ncbi:MAG: cell filamentation protein Fic [Mesorhizobium sp.]|uniref:Fic family protein n=1 Tax=Mesorhizobium sp. M7A.F.Ca.ET.027.02.1.1 TaxID=2496655 RepID=UPI000FD4A27F|nr:Fic family protein [Mesorhizobium sp. M7A.F.Ca.ET.027.02.1.1]RVD14678.1 cell filamentation protein Fic [Mesorhizobium sp. M7A.F.Ca.ET.027.02.1.1]RWC99061.1 MAG: cell filamentation protein Fic [Mesorhizobium sp.]
MAVDHNTQLEIENGFRQYDLTLDVIRYYLEPDRPFALRVPLILDLQREAVKGIEAEPGEIRKNPVGIHKSKHTPPPPHLVTTHLTEFCDYINDNWHERTAFYLSAYAMWRLNWIHPFTDGNGRTSRALSYVLLSTKLGYVLPGSPTIPQQIESDNSHYIEALEMADEAARNGKEDISEMEKMIRAMLAKQLVSVIDQAGGQISN